MGNAIHAAGCAAPFCNDALCGQPPQMLSESGSYFGRRDFLKSALGAGLGLTGLAISGCASTMVSGPPADTIIINARVAVMDKRRRMAGAIAIRGETVAAFGSE